MALQYLSSSNVHMFPSSMRSYADDVYSRFTTEMNLVDMVNRVSTGKFVTESWVDGNGNTWVDFTLLGYHFDANIQSLISGLSTGQSLYAIAIVGYDDSESKYDSRLKGYTGGIQSIIDQGDSFLGVTFTTSLDDYNSISFENLNGTYIKDYLEIGIKDGTSTFTVNTTTTPVDIETLTDQEVNDLWNNTTI